MRMRPLGQRYGAIAAWAWAYMRCVDVLRAMEDIDPKAIVVTGHSRGGKAALLAGVLDKRIALTHANNSGTGGSGSFHTMGPGSETLAQLVAAFPHWMGRKLDAYAGREADFPFDQHLIKAMIAPRALLTTDASGDAWANPSGCQVSFEAAQQVFALLKAKSRCAIVMRKGGHPMLMQDWKALLNFADRQMGRN
jgi:dienelactone hydrolase